MSSEDYQYVSKLSISKMYMLYHTQRRQGKYFPIWKRNHLCDVLIIWQKCMFRMVVYIQKSHNGRRPIGRSGGFLHIEVQLAKRFSLPLETTRQKTIPGISNNSRGFVRCRRYSRIFIFANL